MKLAVYVAIGFIAIAALLSAGFWSVFDSPYSPALSLLGAASVMFAFTRLGLQR